MIDESSLPERLRALARRVGAAARAAAAEARDAGLQFATPTPVAAGAGDVTFALDRATETAVDDWLKETSREGPLSLLTEDRGWRHQGPRGPLPGFDHGGPRVVIDPVDGTRQLMADLRSAWTVIAACGPGSAQPTLSGAHLELRELEGGTLLSTRPLAADGDDRPDHGYFSFFRYAPAQRPRLAEIEARFFERLAAHEGADTRSCYDDQYISNGGQLVLLALGTYRLIADLRAALVDDTGAVLTCSKPYDCAGALLVAREAGCAVSDAAGAELEFHLDATTPVTFVGWASRPTWQPLSPASASDGVAPCVEAAQQEAP
jgi:fructose-1,6-bisphosphatase/inositol monophosphatase family enzyme